MLRGEPPPAEAWAEWFMSADLKFWSDPARIRSGQLRVMVIAVAGAALLLGAGEIVTGPWARLGAEGVVVEGTVTKSTRENAEWKLWFAYTYGEFTQERATPRDPRPAGTPLAVVVLPDRPWIAWADAPPTEAELAALALPFRALAGMAAGVGLAFVLSTEVARRRAIAGRADAPAAIGGRMLWLLLASAFVGVTAFDPASGAVIDQAFGLTGLGVPTTPLRAAMAFAIVLPSLWTTTDLMALQVARPPGGSVAFVAWIASDAPARAGLHRERRRVGLTFAAYGALCAAWIAWAAYVGV